MKIGIYVAHEDDVILAMGGQIVQFVQNGDDVYIVIVTDGRHSHKAVLQIEKTRHPMRLRMRGQMKSSEPWLYSALMPPGYTFWRKLMPMVGIGKTIHAY